MFRKVKVSTIFLLSVLMLQGCGAVAMQGNTEKNNVLTITEEPIHNTSKINFEQFDFSSEQVSGHGSSDSILLRNYQDESYSFHYSFTEELQSNLLFEPHDGQMTFAFSTGGFEVRLYQYNGTQEKELLIETKDVQNEFEQVITFTNLPDGVYYFELHSDTEQVRVGQGQLM